MSIGGLASVAVLLSACVSCAKGARRNIDWATFLGLISGLADDRAGEWDQDGYVERVAEVLQQLKLSDPGVLKPLAATRSRMLMSPDFTTLHHTQSFEILSIIFDKGQLIRHHDHPGMTGVLACASGRLLVKSYERLGVTGEMDPCFLRAISVQRLGRGDVSTLTAERANVHFVQAEDRTQVIDIFTPPYNDDRRRGTHWFEVDPTPINSGGNLYRASSF
jgi:hypothetical protein